MKVTEDDVIGLLLGELGPEREAQIRQVLESDARLAALHAEWSAILPGLRSEAERVKAMQQRAIERAMLRLKEERPDTSLDNTAIRVFHLRPARMVAAAAACLLVLSLGFAGTRIFEAVRPATDRSQAVVPVEDPVETIYVAFSHQAREGDGSSANPYASLAEGLEALEDGGTIRIEHGIVSEAFRISTPVRLVAENGTVQIGRWD